MGKVCVGDQCGRNTLDREVMSADRIHQTIPVQMLWRGKVEGGLTDLNSVQWQFIVTGNHASSAV